MKWLLPFPFASGGLFIFWLLINQSLSPGQVVLAVVVAVVGGWAFAALQPPETYPRRLGAILRLTAFVLADILRSNIAVALIVLGVEQRQGASGFVEIPLELREPYGLAVLACIITSTPGTVWVDFNEADGMLTIHVFDLVDRATWNRTIKGRYERLLLEIFA